MPLFSSWVEFFGWARGPSPWKLGKTSTVLNSFAFLLGPLRSYAFFQRSGSPSTMRRATMPIVLNGLLLATPVYASLSFLSQWPGAPEQERYA
jgi:hypothetical protein